MQDIQLDENKRTQLDSNIKKMLEGGATQDDVMKYASDFKSQFGQKKNSLTTVSSATPLQSPSQNDNRLQAPKSLVPSPNPVLGNTLQEAVAKDKKNDSILGGVYNTLVGSIGSLAGGIVEAESLKNRAMGIAPTIPTRKFVEDFVNKARLESSSVENEQKR